MTGHARRARRRWRLVPPALVVAAAVLAGTTASGAAPEKGPGAASVTTLERYRVVPGLTYRHWLVTGALGTAHVHVLRADLTRPGLSLEYAGADHVSDRAPLTSLLADEGAVAGVNADFFDLSDTGAPLGVGIDGGRVLHGPRSARTTFSVSASARARIRAVAVVPRITGRPGLGITNLNSPHVPRNGIGLYTPRWGSAPGYAVTDAEPPRTVRQVVIRGGRVVSNTRSVTTGTTIEGRILLGRGAGAADLAHRLPVGAKAHLEVSVAASPRVAVSGRPVLVTDGRVVAPDDTELDPRTAVGVDTDTGRVLLVVVDGRSESSIGCTLMELAGLMVRLGAEQALNLDGGGSATMAVTPPGGALGVANTPSGGS